MCPKSMKVCDIKFVKCKWYYNGYYTDRNGYYGYHYADEWNYVDDYDNEELIEMVREHDWVNLKLQVKPI